MTRTSLLALLASVPGLALAQTAALDAARGASETANEANAAIVREADAASAPEPAPVSGAAPAPASEAEPSPTSNDLADYAREIGLETYDSYSLDGSYDAYPPEEYDALPPEGTTLAAPQGDAVPPPDTYTVRPGDTLWDLAGRFLSNPWYWPKLWSYNPDIVNPHWIFPGDAVRFAPEAATPAPIAGAEPMPEPIEAPRRVELEDFSRGELGKPADTDAVAVAGPYKIGYVAPRAMPVRHDTFVTRRQLEESGELTASFDPKRMLSTLDQAYARFKTAAPVKPGETYVLYKTNRAIHHPVSGELIGYQTEVLGAARVLRVEDRAATVVITQAFNPIERGTLLGPWSERFSSNVVRRANTRSLDGRIVAAQVEVVSQLGEHHVVFIDKGSEDGVEEGNLFHVVRSGDPLGKRLGTLDWDENLPKETVGDLLVIDVRPNASAALVTRSLTELAVGDRVEMRPEGVVPNPDRM